MPREATIIVDIQNITVNLTTNVYTIEIRQQMIQYDTMSHPIESNTFEYNHRICMGKCIGCGFTGCGSRIENRHKHTLRKNSINFYH